MPLTVRVAVTNSCHASPPKFTPKPPLCSLLQLFVCFKKNLFLQLEAVHFPSQREAHSCAGSISTPHLPQFYFVFFLGGGWVVCCWLFFPSFIKVEKKALRRTPQGGRQPIFTMGNLQTQEKTTIERLTEEADQKKPLSKPAKTHRSHSWSLCFCTTDKTGSVINHLSSRHRGLREGSCRAKKGPTQAPRQAPRRD